MELTGNNFVAGQRRGGDTSFQAREAGSGKEFGPAFRAASVDDVADACAAAMEAQPDYASRPLAERAAFLCLAADKIDALGDRLTKRAMRETGLPEARLNGERGRTVAQLRLFADEVENGAWQNVRIDHADKGRTPPKPDLRLRMVPLGPVAVFGASNFPLAFSVAGGDTASALAAGCCVVVKGHPAHPGTGEMVATALTEAVAESGFPAGVFSLLNGKENALGEALVKNQHITAVGFTGSRGGGLALVKHAADRPVPIPVYAEMSSINPVTLLPNRLSEAPEELAKAYVASLSMGAGQFCTNPGIVLALESAALDQFIGATADALKAVSGQTMLTANIHKAFEHGAKELAKLPGARLVGTGEEAEAGCGRAQVYTVSSEHFRSDENYVDEVFGPSSIIIRCRDIADVKEVLAGLEGQLTSTLHMNEKDYEAAARLVPILEQISGRILANGWPTGVEVTHAMVHGGPFPATSDGRSTSVGTLAIDRFLRPVSYQDIPAELLPKNLRDDGAKGLRRVDGEYRV